MRKKYAFYLLANILFLLSISCMGMGAYLDDPADFTETVAASGEENTSTIYKIFVTAATYNANLGGISTADTYCMSDSNYTALVGGTGTYKAFLADGANRVASVTGNAGDGQVDWVLKPDTTYYRADGVTPIFTTGNNGIFFFGTATNSMLGSGTEYHTGMGADWVNGQDCSNFTDGSSLLSPVRGIGNATDDAMLANTATGTFCSVTRAILCVEQ